MPDPEITFDAELVEGHKGVTVVLVPFDPEEVFGAKPFRLAGRRHGWPVRARIGRVAFPGYIGERWGKRFLIVDAQVRARAKLRVGDPVTVAVCPTEEPAVVAQAYEQSTVTTQPAKPRPDARRAERDVVPRRQVKESRARKPS